MNSDMTIPERRGSYSATVDLHLRVNGCLFPAAQVGHNMVILSEARALPEGPAEIIAEVDGHQIRWPVQIENRELVRKTLPIVLGQMIA